MFAVAATAVLVALALSIVCAIKGPSVFDRLLAGNTFGTLSVMLLAVMGFLAGRPEFLDVGLTYGVLNLIVFLAVLRFFRHSDLAHDPDPYDDARPYDSDIESLDLEGEVETVTLILDLTSWAFILGGSFFTVVGALGLMRMPDVFTRIQAVGLIDTLGVGLLIVGMMLQAGFSLVTLKLLFLLALVFFTWPVVTHALAQLCLVVGIQPLLVEDRDDLARRRRRRMDQGGPSSN